MNENTVSRANARANAPRPTPVWSYTITLNTDFAQRVFKRTWDRLKGDLFVLTVRTRASGMDEAARAIEDVISEGFDSARKDLDSELARSEALLDSVKLTELPTYKGAQVLEAEYSTPRAKEFLHLLMQMDQLLMRYDALWLTGNIETHPRVQRSQNWQRRLIKIANRLRELGNRTRAGLTKEAERRAAKNAAGRASVSTDDTEANSVEQDQDLHAVKSSDEHDTASQMEGDLSELAGTGTAGDLDDVDSMAAASEVSDSVSANTAATELPQPEPESESGQLQETAQVEPKRRRRSAVAAAG